MANASGSDESSMWTREEEKLLEDCLVEIGGLTTPCCWERVSALLGTKSAAEVERRYALLLGGTQAGMMEPPAYPEMYVAQPEIKQSGCGGPWTKEEHRLFLAGMEEYGKGDWKSIARNVVLTRTPTQVAIHAQKHFKRLEGEREREREEQIRNVPFH